MQAWTTRCVAALPLRPPILPLTRLPLSQFAAVREAAQRLLQARRDLEIHQEALSRLQHGYRPSGEATDFEAELRGHADAAAASKP